MLGESRRGGAALGACDAGLCCWRWAGGVEVCLVPQGVEFRARKCGWRSRGVVFALGWYGHVAFDLSTSSDALEHELYRG